MTEWIFGTIWGWIGTAGLIVIACVLIAYFVKPWRPYAIAIAAVAVSLATVFTRGYTARGRLEKQRRDEAVRKAQEAYDHIETRPDTPDTVADRLRRGSF